MHTSFEDSDILGNFNDDPIPLRLQPAPIKGAMQIAILVQAIPLQQAAELIDQYVRAECAAARLDATAATIDRCIDIVESQSTEPEPAT